MIGDFSTNLSLLRQGCHEIRLNRSIRYLSRRNNGLSYLTIHSFLPYFAIQSTLTMTQNHERHFKALEDIRSMMERSSRFISLSGLSGIAAGVIALLGAAAVYWYLEISPFDQKVTYYQQARAIQKWGMDYVTFFLLDATVVLLLAVAAGIFFTTRKARMKGQKIWDPLTRRLLINLMIPLITGGLFCVALFSHGFIGPIAPATLVFYGLALINASKYTFNDIRYLGVSEIVLGMAGLFYMGYGLELWAIGFGLLHILYGSIMYFKYERVYDAG